MNERSVKHNTFVIEKHYKATPERVYFAWSDPAAKAQWFPKAELFEFRVGGREFNRGGPTNGPIYTFDACYQEIVPNSRIVYTYTMDQGDIRISVSITTVEIKQSGSGTHLIYTEQGAFLDGYDTPEQRKHGTNLMLEALGKRLEEE
ncbi:polyketide cyclase [Paenibacillus nanensis]|uniref:Polyketide cyclase n=1 Tax=Paenibacillus nanensis TaxID=393251 RepID=A0A3A1UUS5_9BACL|nr:SRPBCC family protein [Paenibacillus nanensis]RIX52014.1 polyketide cyclase [Paenibacillus nanensis]